MTQPGQDTDAAFDQIASIAAGNSNLVSQPRIVAGLVSANASPPQAQAVNQLAGAAWANSMVQTARAAGTKLNLTSAQKKQLDAAGVNYSDVLPSNHWSLGRVWHDITHNPVTDVFGQAGNFVNATVGGFASMASRDIGGAVHWDLASANSSWQADYNRQMQVQGYDPNSVISNLAYLASGHAQLDLNDLYKNYDPKQVDFAIQVANGGDDFINSYLGDPKITMGELQKRANQLQDPKFTTLVDQVSARHATFGDWVLEPADPKQDVGGKVRGISGAAIDLVVGAKLDPTLLAGQAFKAYKLAPITIDSMGDTNKVRDILSEDPATQVKGWGASQVRQGFKSLIENTTAMREAIAKGDDVAAGQSYARIRAQTPGLVHLVDDFNGSLQATGIGKNAETGRNVLLVGKGTPITSLDDAADYLASKYGMVRLFAGRAPSEIGLMPGQLSRFGFKKLAGSLNATRVGLSADKTAKTILKNIDAADVNLAGHVESAAKRGIDLRIPGMAGKLLPVPGDQVDSATGKIIDSSDDVAAEGLASQQRATLDSALKGEALYASQKGLSVGAFGARYRKLAQKFASRLPKSATFRTSDQNAVSQVFAHARMQLTSADSYITAAKYSVADEGTRKAILSGMNLQSMHAAGFGATEAGQKLLAEARRPLTDQVYSVTGSRYLDPVTGEERDTALFGGQTNEVMTLTGFTEMQQAAAKLGIWQNTIGRMFNSKFVNQSMQLVRNGWVSQFAGALRNALEEQFGEAIRSKGSGIHGMFAAKYALDDAGQLPSAIIPSLMKKTKAGNLVYGQVHRLTQLYHHAAIDTADAREGTKYILNLKEGTFADWIDQYMDLRMKEMLDPAGVGDSTEIAAAGMTPARVRYQNLQGIDVAVKFDRTGFAKVSAGHDAENFADLQKGSEAFAAHLATLVNKSPEQTMMILNHVDSTVGDLLGQVGKPTVTGLSKKASKSVVAAAKGRRFTIDDVVSSLKKDPAWDRISRRSGTFKDADGIDRPIVTDADRQLADRQIAEMQVRELKYLLTKQDGTLNKKLVQFIGENEKAPNSDWIINNLEHDERPSATLAPTFEAMPLESTKHGLMEKLLDVSGEGYKLLVERPLARMATMPIFAANYGRMRYFMRGWEDDLVNGGLSAEAADQMAQDIGFQMAANRTLKYIDNPEYRTQMDVVARGFFAFQRATEAFIRRWGTQMIEDPVRLRRTMMAHEAAVQSGLIYKDENGDESFVYPGSGAAINAILQAGEWLHIPGITRVPGVVPNLTSKVGFLNSGLQNPLQLGLTPLANMPMRLVAKVHPAWQEQIDQIDQFFNGKLSPQQKSLGSELMPAAIKKFSDALSDDDKSSLVAGAMKSAILNLAAAGKLPKDSQDSAQMQDYLVHLRTGVKNQMLLRAIFGFFAPAAPSTPTEETSGSKGDWFYGARGVNGLDAEYKKLVSSVGYQQANVVWAQLHPDKLIYQISGSESTTKSATLQATKASEQWINENVGFMKKYKGVSAYFVPQSAQQGEFDLNAYHAELEIGLRQNKTTAQFANEVATAGAAAQYYKNLDAEKAMLQENPDNASDIRSQFAAWKQEFFGLHPMFGATQQDFSAAQGTAKDQLQQLHRMVATGDAPAAVPVSEVSQMLRAYDTYHSVVESTPGGTNGEVAIRADVAAKYAAWMEAKVAANPQLAGLYSGVFRMLDPNVLDPVGS